MLNKEGEGLRALDLFCGAGGATRGLQMTGFKVLGVDINPQPRYVGDWFVQDDALSVTPEFIRRFDFVWASPPCQAYCGMTAINKAKGIVKDHPRLIDPVRELLQSAGVPYCIENVPGAPLIDPIRLCGSSFGLKVWRHRLFECSFPMLAPRCEHASSPKPIAVYGDHPQQPGDKTYRVNRARSLAQGQDAMGIDWMDWRTLTQSIPPAFSAFIAQAFLQQRQRKAA